MEHKTFQVPNIGCAGCVRTIESELKAIDGIAEVSATIADKTVSIAYSAPATWEGIVNALTAIDYAPAQA